MTKGEIKKVWGWNIKEKKMKKEKRKKGWEVVNLHYLVPLVVCIICCCKFLYR
jgi:hypothetical protein